MVAYLLKKILILLASLLIVATVTFFLMRGLPGDPFINDRGIPEEILQAIYRHYGLDAPWYTQYVRYLKGLLTFDFGPSFKHEGRSVATIIFQAFPVSFHLGLQSLLLSIFLGISLGATAAFSKGKWRDQWIGLISVLGISVPSFVFATCLQFFFCIKWDILPVARWGSFQQTLLPMVSLAALPTAFIAKLVRTSMLEVLGQDYVQTARAKGLSSKQVFFCHILRNSLLPVTTYLGPLTSTTLTGSFVIEKIFGIPGLGQWFVNSILNRDYPLIMGVTIFYSALLMLCVLIVDLLYCVIDPRIQWIRHTDEFIVHEK